MSDEHAEHPPNVRDAIVQAWKETGWTMKELSRRSGVSYDVINKLVNRPNSSTSGENTKRLEAALQLSGSPTDEHLHQTSVNIDDAVEIAAQLALEIAEQARGFPYEPVAFSTAFAELLEYRITSQRSRDISAKADNVVDFRVRQIARTGE